MLPKPVRDNSREREREIDPGWKLLPCCSKKVITGWKKEKVSQAESGKLRRRTGRTVAGLLLTDNLSVLEEQAGGREEVDNLTFVDRTDTAIQMYCWYW